MTPEELQKRFAMTHDARTARRTIAGVDVIVHCHHYNSRIQRTIESASGIDGKKIFTSTAEAVFSKQFGNALRPSDSTSDKWDVLAGLYGHLGFGTLDRKSLETASIVANQSHFVEGWNAGFPERKQP